MINRFKELFKQQLLWEHLAALAELFRLTVPEVLPSEPVVLMTASVASPLVPMC